MRATFNFLHVNKKLGFGLFFQGKNDSGRTTHSLSLSLEDCSVVKFIIFILQHCLTQEFFRSLRSECAWFRRRKLQRARARRWNNRFRRTTQRPWEDGGEKMRVRSDLHPHSGRNGDPMPRACPQASASKRWRFPAKRFFKKKSEILCQGYRCLTVKD